MEGAPPDFEDPPSRPRKAWVAGLLTLLTTGLGHVYAGRPRRGLFFWCLSWVLGFGLVLGFALKIANPPLTLASAAWVLILCGALFVAYILCVVVDAARTARAATDFQPQWFNRWYIYAGIVLLGGSIGNLGSALVKRNVVQAFWFPSGSMQPTLLPGDHFFVDKRAYEKDELPARGDVSVFASPVDGQLLVKRVVAVGGDKVEIRRKKLYVNDVPVDEPYAQFIDPNRFISPRDEFGPEVVPRDHFFVLGDNRDRSYDSRYFGTVEVEDLLGRTSVIYWSSGEDEPRWQRIGMRIR
jgi:signal peptidase I